MGWIKRTIQVCGILSLVLLLTAFAGTTYVLHRGHSLDRESHAFTDAAVTAVVSQWSADELLRRAAPQFLRASTPGAVRAFVAGAATRFGPLISYEGAQGQARSVTDKKRGTRVTAIYISHALFQKGEAEFQIALVKVADRWMITEFHLSSPKPAAPAGSREA